MAVEPTAQELARLEEFLRPSMIAVVATVGRTGMPHLTPNWYRFTNGRLTMSTTKERIKHRNLSRDPQMAVCIYSGTDAGRYAAITGKAEISDDESIWPETRAIIERYVKPEGVEDRMRLLRTQDRVIISLTPDRVVFRT